MKWIPEKLLPQVLLSGQKAMEGFGKVKRQWKGDQSVVTETDRAIEQQWHLYCKKEKTFLLGEETIAGAREEAIQRGLGEDCFILDPIDGTAPYSYALPQWGISLAYAEKGLLTQGLLYFPQEENLLYTQGGEVYQQKIGPYSQEPLGGQPLSKPVDLDPMGMLALSQGVAKEGTIPLPNPVQVVGSCVWSMARLIQGSYLAYMASFKIWDFAAALVMLDLLGFAYGFSKTQHISLRIQDLVSVQEKSARRWMTREEMIFAQNQKALEFVRKHLGSKGTFLEN